MSENRKTSIEYNPELLTLPSYQNAVLRFLCMYSDETNELASRNMRAIEEFHFGESIRSDYPVACWVRDALKDELESSVRCVLEGVRSMDNDSQSFQEGCTVLFSPAVGSFRHILHRIRVAWTMLGRRTEGKKRDYVLRYNELKQINDHGDNLSAIEVVLSKKDWPSTWNKLDVYPTMEENK